VLFTGGFFACTFFSGFLLTAAFLGVCLCSGFFAGAFLGFDTRDAGILVDFLKILDIGIRPHFIMAYPCI
jgi:hypothetical protein